MGKCRIERWTSLLSIELVLAYLEKIADNSPNASITISVLTSFLLLFLLSIFVAVCNTHHSKIFNTMKDPVHGHAPVSYHSQTPLPSCLPHIVPSCRGKAGLSCEVARGRPASLAVAQPQDRRGGISLPVWSLGENHNPPSHSPPAHNEIAK